MRGYLFNSCSLEEVLERRNNSGRSIVQLMFNGGDFGRQKGHWKIFCSVAVHWSSWWEEITLGGYLFNSCVLKEVLEGTNDCEKLLVHL